MATKEEDGCTIKVESMDAVHGRGRRPQSWKATGQLDGGLAPLRWGASHGDVALGA